MQETSFYVRQIEESMRPLIGIIDNTEIAHYGLQAAWTLYDKFAKQLNNGIPEGNKELIVSQAFAMAYKNLVK